MQNSSLLTYRNRIKQNRQIIQRNFRRDIERRKKESNYSFQLPHTGSKEELLVPERPPISRRYKTECG